MLWQDNSLARRCEVRAQDIGYAFEIALKFLKRVRIPEQRYAVFTHRGPVSNIRATWEAIHQWLPTSGYKRLRAPDFERYGEKFDARSKSGWVEIWVPVESA